MTDQNNKPPVKPFGTRPGTTSLPGSKPRPPAPPPPLPTPSSRFNQAPNLRSRFGATTVNWDVLPVGDTLVCFSLDGLGGSLKYLMGDDLPVTSGSYESVLQSIENDPKAQAKLTATLDAVWKDYELIGAMLIYGWKDTTRDVILSNARLTNSKPVFLRAFDPLLVLNVLARSRDNLLQPSAPTSFDSAYVDRALISDDPRLVKLVQISGYFEEVIPNPPRPKEAEEDESE
jgi:hypothetical protein